MSYKYIAYNTENRIIKGTLPVTNENLAVESLKRANLKIISLKEVKNWNLNALLPAVSNIKHSDIVLFSRQLSLLLKRGTGFLSAIQIVQEQTNNKKFKQILNVMIDDVKSGITFSTVINKQPKIFPIAYSRMIKVGEETGKLDVVLSDLANNMERDEKIKKKIKAALIYPTFMLVLGILTVIILIAVVLPSFIPLFSAFNTNLPWTTRMLIAIMDFITVYGLYVLLVILAIIMALFISLKKPSGRYRLEKFLSSLPVVKRALILRNLSNFSRIMSMLLSAGLPLTEIIDITKQSLHSELLRQSLNNITPRLFQGQSLSQAMKEEKNFPRMLVQMIVTGESTNSLETNFTAVADYYESEFNDAIAAVTSLLEPLLIAIMGIGIGFIAVSIISPIYSIYGVI